ncbi:Monooxygenase 1 [Linum perenne]
MEGKKMMNEEIVIVGGGICGLATALALHRKGIRSTVIERSEEVRAMGAAIIMHENGWKALEELGVASVLRPGSPSSLQSSDWTESGQFFDSTSDVKFHDRGELRVIRRSDLIKTLADRLPEGTIRLGCKVVGIELHPTTSYPQIHLHDGSVIDAKVVVGCDGWKSVVAKMALGLDSTTLLPICATRGFAYFENGHDFGDRFHVHRDLNTNSQLGHFPMSKNLVYWFLVRPCTSKDSTVAKDQNLIKQTCLQTVKSYPPESQATVKNADVTSLHLTELRYRSPWDVLTTNFRRGTVTIAGDAMHAMGPFLAQGGAASLEDAVVFADRVAAHGVNGPKWAGPSGFEAAIDEYVKLRRMRLFRLSFDTYLIGKIISTKSWVVRFLCILVKVFMFGDVTVHQRYDCRRGK